ncbi:IS3 family transposase [Sorangium sp. So ce513]|uniref:IS3 family transposase n=1 Tax=Sorangium sp. So ce513 TaxID=3133315 RepID=UPI003F604D4C
MILGMVSDAVAQGAPETQAAALLGLSARTLQRWREQDTGDDRRLGPKSRPRNQLSDHERKVLLATVNAPRFRDLSPSQIVPRLADEGRYIGSESTVLRLLRHEGQLTHRGRAKAPVRTEVEEHIATGPNQLWSWDISYLKTTVRGRFYFLYLIVDIYSRRIMGWAVHEEESGEHAAALFRATCAASQLDPKGLVFRSDNGGPMRGSTLLATLDQLGVRASFSRPGVSADNAFSEALFRTVKYRADYPGPFDALAQARAWVGAFVTWYNGTHRHSALRFVTPDDRHRGRDASLLAARARVYERARRRHPERWSGETRNWTPVGAVRLGPRKPDELRGVSNKEALTA